MDIVLRGADDRLLQVRLTGRADVETPWLAPGDRNADAILARADRALYRARDRGRNRVEVAEPP
jgi:PleD family two-component response regulator